MPHRPKSSLVNVSTCDTSLTIINDSRSKAESDDDVQEHEMGNIDDKEKGDLDV